MKIKWISILLSLLILAGCATTMPSWAKNVPKSSLKFYGIGQAKLSNNRMSDNTSVTRARSQLASQVNAVVKQAAIDYQQEGGTEQQRQALNFAEYISLELTNVSLNYTRIEEKKITDDGTYWTLMSIKKYDVKKSVRDAEKAVKAKYKHDEKIAKYDSKGLQEQIDFLLDQ